MFLYYFLTGGPICLFQANGCKGTAWPGQQLCGCDGLTPAPGKTCVTGVRTEKWQTVAGRLTKTCTVQTNITMVSRTPQCKVDRRNLLASKSPRSPAEQAELNGLDQESMANQVYQQIITMMDGARGGDHVFL